VVSTRDPFDRLRIAYDFRGYVPPPTALLLAVTSPDPRNSPQSRRLDQLNPSGTGQWMPGIEVPVDMPASVWWSTEVADPPEPPLPSEWRPTTVVPDPGV
jgi:hypothetical protein